MRGYFAIGIEGVSKPGNMGNLIRTAHGFGAAFVFAIRPKYGAGEADSLTRTGTDTSKTAEHIPFFEYDGLDELSLPQGCQMVGIEITDEATELPSFRHPAKAAYILGSERFSLSPEIISRCDHVIKIPTKFSLNVATAGAIVMYDRHASYGRYAERPVTPSGDAVPLPEHVHGEQRARKKRA
jgi:tRNA G18 (ribose-2'-O)-methylase SpoU